MTWRLSPYKILYYSTISVISIGFFVICGLAYYSSTLPNPSVLAHGNIPASTKIFDRNGALLYEIHGEYKRTQVALSEISPNLVKATIAAEDKNFYHHNGISLSAIVRAAWVNYRHNTISQGGSTITQQLAKNALLNRDRTWERKIKEALLAIRVEQQYNKSQILNMYLNHIPYGRNAYGAEAASSTYFAKPAKNLSIAESAYLAALPQAPSFYMSAKNRAALEQRKDLILGKMYEQGYISQSELDNARAEKVVFRQAKTPMYAPYFVQWVEDYLKTKYSKALLEEGGLKVYTTLDLKTQEIAEKVVEEGAAKNSVKYNAHNASLVAIDSKTEQVLAMVGGKNYYGKPEPAGCTSGLNCAFDPNVNASIRELQAGSSMKPYTYLTAFGPQFRYAPASMILDRTQNFAKGKAKPYVPRNYNGREYGLISMRQALAGSLNVSAVRTLDLVGVDSTVQTARNLGLTSSFKNCGLSLTLGGCEVKLIEHVGGYSVIANGGIRNGLSSILRIEDRNGKSLEEYHAKKLQAADPQAVYELVSIMTDNDARSFVFGKRSPLTLSDRPVAAKTGTTQKFHDGWTVGFTPQITAGVWVGNNDGRLMRANADGVVVAAPIWHAFMEAVHKDLPVEEFGRPEGILEAKVNPRNGLLATPFTYGAKNEVFADYSLPTKFDHYRAQPVPPPATQLASTKAIQLDIGGISDDENPIEQTEPLNLEKIQSFVPKPPKPEFQLIREETIIETAAPPPPGVPIPESEIKQGTSTIPK
jgi:1A family penicillin-binding protein